MLPAQQAPSRRRRGCAAAGRPGSRSVVVGESSGDAVDDDDLSRHAAVLGGRLQLLFGALGTALTALLAVLVAADVAPAPDFGVLGDEELLLDSLRVRDGVLARRQVGHVAEPGAVDALALVDAVDGRVRAVLAVVDRGTLVGRRALGD